MNSINLKSAPPEVIEKLRWTRWKCRTDLKFLCNHILGMGDVSEAVHRPVLNHLQQFPLPSEEIQQSHDRITNGKWDYTPAQDILDLPGKRRVLLLDGRGFLKSSINCIAHSIQWIINYPDIAIMVMQANGDKANMVVSEIKQHFVGNDKFRALFPELCPQKRVWEWGRQDSFTVEDKRVGKPRGGVPQHKEPTVMATSIERGLSGIHVDVIKCSDIVDPGNINGEGLQTVKKNFFLARNLLVAPQYWIDVEGTRYHFDDLYGKIIDMEAEKPEELREWKIFVRGATRRDWGGKTERFDSMDFLMKPEILDSNGYAESRWPERFSNKLLHTMKLDDPLGYATQQQQDPRPGGIALFPVDHQFPKWISPKDFVENIRVSHYEISVDTAETTGKRSDYTSIAVGAWSSNGKCYVVEIVHGRFLPSELIDRIVALVRKYQTRLRALKIEETGFVRGMMPALRRIMDTSGLHIPIDLIKRDNREAKVERIANTLQPWYVRGDIIFVDGMPNGMPKEKFEEYWQKTKNALLRELREFPSGKHDDILDSISDLFQNKQWFGREQARGFAKHQLNLEFGRMLGILTPEQEDQLGTDSLAPAPGLYGVY